MRDVKLSGVVTAVAIVLASASGCAVASGDAAAEGSSDEAYSSCPNDPVYLGLHHTSPTFPKSGTCLYYPYNDPYPTPLTVDPALTHSWDEPDLLPRTPDAACLKKVVRPYCPGKLISTNAKWLNCYDRRPHYLVAVECEISPARLAVLVNQCGAEAEAFAKDSRFPPLDAGDVAWLAFDPVGSGPHKN